MKRFRWRTKQVLSFATVSALGFLSTRLSAQQPNSSDLPFIYEAKFLCTANIPGTSQVSPSVLPGSYLTVISVHSPTGQPTLLRQRIAVTFPAGAGQPGEVSAVRESRLPAGSAVQIDCGLITGGSFGIQFSHGAEGVLTIESSRRINVHAAYTAGSQGGSSIAVEEVGERQRPFGGGIVPPGPLEAQKYCCKEVSSSGKGSGKDCASVLDTPASDSICHTSGKDIINCGTSIFRHDKTVTCT